MIKRFEQFQDMYASLFPPKEKKEGVNYLPRTVTFQVTNQCNLCCSYCYEINKGTEMMTKEVAKEAIDLLFKMYEEDNVNYICNFFKWMFS